VYERLFARDDLPCDVVGLRSKATREAAWRAATAFYRSGDFVQARQFAHQAVQENLLAEAQDFAVGHLLYNESSGTDDICEIEWLRAVLDDLCANGLGTAEFAHTAVQACLEAKAFQTYWRGCYWQSAGFAWQALKHDVGAWRNRGLCRIFALSVMKSVASFAR
jgi:hypothetical protein